MRRLLTLIALAAGTLVPVAGALGTPATAAPTDPTGIGIRLVDAPVDARDNPRARVYIVDHVAPGSTVQRRIEVSNDTGAETDLVVYAAAASIVDGSFVGLAGDTPNELSTWTTIGTPALTLADRTEQMVDVTIDVPADAAPGEQYAVLWAQTSSGGEGAISQVSRVGVRVYLSVGPGGEPASAFDIESFTASRDPGGSPMVTATVRNTGGRALDLHGELSLGDGPGGLSAGPFPVTLGTTLGRDEVAPVEVRLDEELPAGPWQADLEITSGLLTENARASLTFPDAGSAPAVAAAAGPRLSWLVGGGALLLVLLATAWWVLRSRRPGGPGGPGGPASHRRAAPRRHAGPVAGAVLLAGALLAGPWGDVPAQAQQTAVSNATVTLVGGGLSITAPSDAGNLASASNEVGAVVVSGTLGQVQVTDSRGAPAGSGWTATAISTAFTPPVGAAIGAGAVGYTAGEIVKTGTATYVANDPITLSGVSPVVTATAITGDNSATWNPTVTISVPANLSAGVYAGSITHSVS